MYGYGIPVESLALTTGIRFFIFEHLFYKPYFKLLLANFPNWLKTLISCPYCNGFWIYLIIDSCLYPAKEYQEYILMLGWGLVSAFINLFLMLIFNVLAEHKANTYLEM